MQKDIGSVLKDLRVKKKISQKNIAEKVGLTQQAIALIESGRRKVDFDLFLRIVDVLNYPITEVISEIYMDDKNLDKFCKYVNDNELSSFAAFLKNCSSSLEKTENATYILNYKSTMVNISENEMYNLMDDIFYYSESVIRRFVQSKSTEKESLDN